MDQMKFIFTSKKVQPKSVNDDGNGKVIVVLRDGVQIIHNYKKNNLMEIIFTEDQSHYQIPSENELDSIYRIHLGCVNFMTPAREYCDKYLKKA